MRGKGNTDVQERTTDRITPAYAGKRGGFCRTRSESGDHPRVCGEKLICLPRFLLFPGSPPRMRGKALREQPAGGNAGITPAYAGKSNFLFCLAWILRDHPRVCGEKGGALALSALCLGSPPRMRGKACLLAAGLHNLVDHPRVCGEKRRVWRTNSKATGSPPRMRGKD